MCICDVWLQLQLLYSCIFLFRQISSKQTPSLVYIIVNRYVNHIFLNERKHKCIAGNEQDQIISQKYISLDLT